MRKKLVLKGTMTLDEAIEHTKKYARSKIPEMLKKLRANREKEETINI